MRLLDVAASPFRGDFIALHSVLPTSCRSEKLQEGAFLNRNRG